jgi:carbonic anhydrase
MHPGNEKRARFTAGRQGSNERGLQCTIYELSMFHLRIPSEHHQDGHIKNIMSILNS